MALTNIVTSLVLDVYHHNLTQDTIKAIALDSRTRFIKATVTDHGTDYPVDENATVTLTILRPDKVGVQITGSVVDVDNTDRTSTIKGVQAELSQTALAKSGKLQAQFMITSGEQVLRTEIFLISNGVALDAEATEWAGEYQGYNLDELVERVEALEQGGGSSFSSDIKAALLAAFRGLVWRDDVDPSALYSALDTAFNPPVNLSSISAVYTQSGSVDIMDSLDSLRNDLVVTAHYSDGTSGVVTGYVLSGSLAEVGTSTITASYGGKTTAFTVIVTSEWTYIWDLTNSLTDTVSGITAVASAGSGVDAPAITSEGLVFNAATQRLSLGDINLDGKTIEIDVESFDFKGSTDAHIRFLLTSSNAGPIIYHKSTGWSAFGLSASGGSGAGWSSQGWWTTSADRKVKNHFNGKTVRLINHTDNTRELYLNNDLVSIMTDRRYDTGTQDLAIGGANTYTQSAGDQCYDMVISAIRIKDTEEDE